MNRLNTRQDTNARVAEVDGWIAQWRQRTARFVVLRPDGSAQAFAPLGAALDWYESSPGSRLLELTADNERSIKMWAALVPATPATEDGT